MKHLLVKSIARIRSKLKFFIYDFVFACDNGISITEKNNPWWPRKESFGPEDLFVFKSRRIADYHCGGQNRAEIISFFPAGNVGFSEEFDKIYFRSFFRRGGFAPKVYRYGVIRAMVYYTKCGSIYNV